MKKLRYIKGCIYCFDTSNGIKIGASCQPNLRLKTHKRAYGNRDSYISECYKNYLEIEKAAHKKLQQYRTHGEVFGVPFLTAREQIESIASEIGVRSDSFEESVQYAFVMSDQLANRLEVAAREKGVSKSEYLMYVLRRYLDEGERK